MKVLAILVCAVVVGVGLESCGSRLCEGVREARKWCEEVAQLCEEYRERSGVYPDDQDIEKLAPMMPYLPETLQTAWGSPSIKQTEDGGLEIVFVEVLDDAERRGVAHTITHTEQPAHR